MSFLNSPQYKNANNGTFILAMSLETKPMKYAAFKCNPLTYTQDKN